MRVEADETIQSAIVDAAAKFESRINEVVATWHQALASDLRLIPTERTIEQEMHLWTKGSKPFKIKPLVNAPRSTVRFQRTTWPNCERSPSPATWMPWGRNGRRSALMRERRSLPNCPPSRLLARSRRARMCLSIARSRRNAHPRRATRPRRPAPRRSESGGDPRGDRGLHLDAGRDRARQSPQGRHCRHARPLGVKIEVAADKRRKAIEAERAKAGATEG
jgi:hypothetical protein